MLKLVYSIILSSGWKRRGIAFAAGAVGALALAPIEFIPAMLAPMSVSVWLIDGAIRAKPSQSGVKRMDAGSIREVAGIGWWLGFGYFLASLWWLGSALLVEPDKFMWALPLAVFGLPAGLALFTALGFVFARLLWCSNGGRVLALAVGLGASEWLRGYALTGFPWNSFGMVLGGNLLLAQAASLVGLYGLTFLTIALFAAPATLIDSFAADGGPKSLREGLRSPTGLAAFLLVAIAGYGAFRLEAGKTELVSGVSLRIMQPNLPQDDKFRPENKERILRQYLSLSDRATSPRTSGVAQVTHLLWPESAFPFILSQDAQSLAHIGSLLGDTTILITGAARTSVLHGASPGQRRTIYYNSMHVIGKGGVILDSYDKTHLVPFGEFIPFSNFFERYGVQQLVHIPGGFEPGTLRKPLSVPKLPPIAALICYEAIFPGEVTPNDGKAERPGMLLNLTNDAWFGATFGPYQHFAQARLRAIEEGLPLVRAANTGISGIVDPYGRVLNQLPLGAEGVLDGSLPKPISMTVFAKHSHMGPLLLLLLMVAGALIFKFRSR